MTIRVLIIDDSATARAMLTARLAGEADIEIVGTAANAAEGRSLIKRTNPDVITLDIEMPGMNGLEFLDRIMRLRPTPVIVISGATQTGNSTAARALALGAVDCYAKAVGAGGMPGEDGGKLASLIRQAAQVRLRSDWPSRHQNSPQLRIGKLGGPRIVAIGSSTGGVEALQLLLRDFSADCPPTLVVQHIDARFAPAVVRMLDEECPVKVELAEQGMPLSKGHVYFAPGGNRHMRIAGRSALHITLRAGEPVSGHVPSVDVLFHSVARTAGADATGILLTGMGSDGARGLLAMAQAGARTIAQDEASCTVFGMPRVAISFGAANIVAPIERIADYALNRAG